MMFVSMVGQASFQTTGRRGPSMIERSYRRPVAGGGGNGALTGLAVGVVEAELNGPARVYGGTRRG